VNDLFVFLSMSCVLIFPIVVVIQPLRRHDEFMLCLGLLFDFPVVVIVAAMLRSLLGACSVSFFYDISKIHRIILSKNKNSRQSGTDSGGKVWI